MNVRGQSSRRRRGHSRIRTLSNSEVSSSGKGSNDEMSAAYQSDESVSDTSHDMLMIDEVHTSQESENLSHSGKDATLDCHIVGQPATAFLNLSTLLPDQVMVDDVDEGEDIEHEIYDDTDSWKKVRPRKHSKQHIELKDLTENDFTSLIEAKNQDKRFYSWLNF